MKTLLFALMAVFAVAQDQVTSPLTVLAPNDDSAPSVVQLQDQAQHTIGFIAPALVTQIVIASATAANPMVLTLANPRPTTITTTSGVTISGATGAGCSGMNTTHTVSAVGTSTITISFNGTGCTYGASSAKIKTSIYWQLPAADCAAGEVWGYSAPYVLACVTGGGGSTPPFVDTTNIIKGSVDATKLLAFEVDGFTTGTTRTLTPQDSSYIIAGTNRTNTFSANQTLSSLDVIFSGTVNLGSSITDRAGESWNYENNSQYVHIYSPTAFTGTQWFIGVNTLTELLYLRDSIATRFEWNTGGAATWGTFGFTDTTSCTLGGACYYVRFQEPGALASTTTYTLPGSYPASNGYALTSTTAGVMSWAANGGANIQLSNLGTTAINANLLFDTDNVYYIGSASGATRIAPNTIYATTEMETPVFRSVYYSGASIADYWDIGANGNGIFAIRDSAGNEAIRYIDIPNSQWVVGSASVTPIFRPYGNGTQDLGASGTTWGSFYTANARVTALGGGGTQCLNTDNDGDLSAVACPAGTGTVTSVGQTFTGGLISVSGSPVTTAGTLALTVAGTSGGVPYFSSASTWASSAALTANLPVIGGGAGGAPSVGTRSGNTTAFVTTTGTQTSGDCVKIDASGNHVAATGSTGSGCASATLGNLTTTQINASLLPVSDVAYDLGSASLRWSSTYSRDFVGANMALSSLAGLGTRCVTASNTGLLGLSSATCQLGTVTSIATSGPIGGGTITSTGTITCTTCVTNVTGTSPIVSSGGTTPALSCSTCVTTAGGQSISGTTTVSTLSVSTAISGTFNVSGNGTVTGNWYERTFSGGNASCGGVSDGWLGVRTDTGGTSGKPEIQVCIGGAMKYSALD